MTYKYDESKTEEENLAIALYAVANEMNKFRSDEIRSLESVGDAIEDGFNKYSSLFADSVEMLTKQISIEKEME